MKVLKNRNKTEIKKIKIYIYINIYTFTLTKTLKNRKIQKTGMNPDSQGKLWKL